MAIKDQVYGKVLEEIRRIVADHILHPRCVPTSHCAELVAKAHPNGGMSSDEIADEIITACIRAHVPVEMALPSRNRRLTQGDGYGEVPGR